MAIPDYESVMLPLLRSTAARGGEKLIPEVVPRNSPGSNRRRQHKWRFLLALTLMIGLTVLLAWAAAAEGARGTAADRIRLPSSPPAATGSRHLSGLDFRIYLPAVFRGYAGCTTLPALISPANGSTLSTISPLYVWDRGTNPAAIGLRLQVATDVAFTQVVNSLGAYGNAAPQFRWPSNLQPGSTYYWRAQLDCGNMRGPYTEVWSFTTGSEGTVLPAPTLLEPANGATTPGPFVTVKWAAVEGAVEYVLFWRKASEAYPGFEWQTGTQKASGWARDTTYVWWVAARNDYAVGPESEHWEFTTSGGALAGSTQELQRSLVAEGGGAIMVFEGEGSK
jgi:hypothetical protein